MVVQSSDICERQKKIKIMFLNRMGAGYVQGMLDTIYVSIFLFLMSVKT
jgi:hypothetical protein